MNVCNEVYRGPPQIFSHVIESYERPQFFPDITLTDDDRHHLHELVNHTNLFNSHIAKIEGEHPIKSADPIYKVFYDERPLSIHGLDEIYDRKLVHEREAGCAVRDALGEAKLVLEAFFALPRVVQVHLLKQH